MQHEITQMTSRVQLLMAQMTSVMQERVRDVSSKATAWVAGALDLPESQIDAMVSEIKAQPMYDTVAKSGECRLECMVLNNFASLKKTK